MTTYLELGLGAGGGGSKFYGDRVANFAALPVSGLNGEVRLTLDTGVIYYWDGAAWNVAETEVATVGHTDTDSIDLSTPGSVLNANLNISADVASVGYLKATTSIKSGLNKGLHVEVPIANTTTTGVLTDTDWDTFNGKEPAISSGTVYQYFRGDKSFQNLNIAALSIIADGLTSDGNTNVLGAKQNSSVISNVAASGNWGDQVSLNLDAGTWLLFGVLRWNDNNAVLTGDIRAGISNAADASTIGIYDYIQFSGMLSDNARDYNTNLPMVILGDTVPFTAYLNVQMQYSSGNPQAGGKIIALRIR